MVVHQSKDTHMEYHKCMPLFCIASGHNMSYIYEWEKVKVGPVGADSPVLWVDSPGLYSCTVTNGMEKCFSRSMRVSMVPPPDPEDGALNLMLTPFDLFIDYRY